MPPADYRSRCVRTVAASARSAGVRFSPMLARLDSICPAVRQPTTGIVVKGLCIITFSITCVGVAPWRCAMAARRWAVARFSGLS